MLQSEPYHMDQHTRSSCIEIIDSGFYFEKNSAAVYSVYFWTKNDNWIFWEQNSNSSCKNE